MLLNLIIAVMTEGYESVKELADETWHTLQFLQIKAFEEKAARSKEKEAASLSKSSKPGWRRAVGSNRSQQSRREKF